MKSVSLLLAVIFCLPLPGSPVFSAWTGPATGNYFDAGNWSLGVPTLGGFAQAGEISNGSTAQLAGTALVNGFSLSNGSLLQIVSGGSLVTDPGSMLSMSGAGMRIDAGGAALLTTTSTAGGTVSNNGQLTFSAVTDNNGLPSYSLANIASELLNGATGNILMKTGTANYVQSSITNALGGSINMEAGSQLHLFTGKTVTNNGQIALAGGQIYFAGTSGIVTLNGSGVLELGVGSKVNATGLERVPIVVGGSPPAGGGTGGGTGNGSGSVERIVVSSAGNDVIVVSGIGHALVNGAGHTIRGAGTIGVIQSTQLLSLSGSDSLINLGTVVADQAAGLTLAGGTANRGVISTSGQGVLIVRDLVDNVGGQITLAAGTTTYVGAPTGNSTSAGGSISGGNVTNSGRLDLVRGGFAAGTQVTNNGVMSFSTNSDLTGTIHNTAAGTIQVNGTGVVQNSLTSSITNDGQIILPGTMSLVGNSPLTLNGSGTLQLAGELSGITASSPLAGLANGVGHTIRGESFLLTDFVNKGNLIVDHSSGTSSSYLAISSIHSAVRNEGNVTVDAGESLILPATHGYEQTAGVTRVDGIFQSVGDIRLTGGIMNGTGTVIGNVINNSGTVAPGHSPGTLHIVGDYFQGADSFLNVVVARGANGELLSSVLDVTGNMTLGGTLNISPVTGFTANVGDIFTFVRGASVSGNFSNINIGGGGYAFGLQAVAGGFDLVVTSNLNSEAPEPGSLLLMSGAALGMLFFRRRTQRRNRRPCESS